MPSDTLRAACVVSAAATGCYLARMLWRASQETRDAPVAAEARKAGGCVTAPTPTLSAGQLTDLKMSFQSWRDVRPFHLSAETPSTSPSPMSSSSELCSLVPVGVGTGELSSDYYQADIAPSTFGFRCVNLQKQSETPPPPTISTGAKMCIEQNEIGELHRAPGPLMKHRIATFALIISDGPLVT